MILNEHQLVICFTPDRTGVRSSTNGLDVKGLMFLLSHLRKDLV